ncbi:type II/IV secretion system protein [Candidatus Parcubacteria bacterium]|nr:type II/IV secretion system protein [Candidatus Parcubacteria bacterium]
MDFLNFLIQKKILDKEKAEIVKQEMFASGKKIEEVILAKELVKENVLFRAKSEMLKIPLREVIPEEVPLKVLELVPEESAKYYKMIPFAEQNKTINIGMVYPEELKTQEVLKFLARQGNFTYSIFLITPGNFSNVLKQYKTLKREVGTALEKLESEQEQKIGGAKMTIDRAESMVEEAPVSKMVAVMLRHAVDGNASDIHIEPTKEKLRVRFRLDGVLHSSLFLPLKTHPAVVARVKILAKLKIDESRIPQDGRFSTNINDTDIDFRVSTFPTTLGEKVVLRVLDPSQGLKDIKNLGFNFRDISIIEKTIQKPYGLFLATGPTGSGKSTTLYTILQRLNQEGRNIVTLEDPVEYFIEGVNQSQIKPAIGYTFAQGLRHILRQDPDIIMVGEIRDEETAALAIHAALTGHFVLSTLHTNNVFGVIPRLIDLGVSPFLLPASLSMVLSQRLVRKLCPFCKKKVRPGIKMKQIIQKEISLLSLSAKKENKLLSTDFYIWEADGCKKCKNSGFSGRRAVFETLEMTKSLSEIILGEPSEQRIKTEARRQGIITMKQDGIIKALQGVTTIEEVLRVAEEK